MKISFILLCFTFLIQFPVTETQAQQNNPLEDLLDSKRKGMLIGGGVAYGFSRFGFSYSYYDSLSMERYKSSSSSTSGAAMMQGKFGYAPSENLAFYVTSVLTNPEPSLGVMMFSEKYPGYYLNGLIGYSSFDFGTDSFLAERTSESNTWNMGLGVGYEFRPHFMFEFMVGYSQLTGIWFASSEYDLNTMTFFVSFNYLFY